MNNNSTLFLLFTSITILLFLTSIQAQVFYNISTIAGNGESSSIIGDGGLAIDATLNNPHGIAFNNMSELFIADVKNNRIRKVSNNGRITTVVGSGTFGYFGERISPLLANLRNPSYITFNSLNELFISDTENFRIRKVSSDFSSIDTFAGTGIAGVSTGVLAISFPINKPRGLVFNGSLSSGELFFADSDNSIIQKVSTSSGILTTVAGGDFLDEMLPKDVTINSMGELLIADTNLHQIRKMSRIGITPVIAGDGFSGFNGDGLLAINTKLSFPSSVKVNSMGEIIFVDSGNYRIRKILQNNTIVTIAGNGKIGFTEDGELAIQSSFYGISYIELDEMDQIYFSEELCNRIRKITLNGRLMTVAGRRGFVDDDDLSIKAHLSNPKGISLGIDGEVYFANGNSIRKIDKFGIISTILGNGNTGIQVSGYFSLTNSPIATAVHPITGDVFIVDSDCSSIRKISNLDGMITSITLTGIMQCKGMTVNYDGDLIIANTRVHTVVRVNFTSGGSSSSLIAGSGTRGFGGDGVIAISALLDSPNAVAVNSKGEIYIADTGNHRIRKISTVGIITTIAGNGVGGYGGDGGLAVNARLYQPSGVAVNSFGEVFIADTLSNRIRKILTNGTIVTIAGNGGNSFNGDGSVATDIVIDSPIGIAVSSNGDIYFSDSNNNRIRKLSPYCAAQGQLVNESCVYSETIPPIPSNPIPTNSTTNNQPTDQIISGNNSSELLTIVLSSVIVPIVVITLCIVIALIIAFIFKVSKNKKSTSMSPPSGDIEMASSNHHKNFLNISTYQSSYHPSTDFPSEQSTYFQATLGSQYKSSGSDNGAASEKYNILEKIGQGAFGSVFKAEDMKKGGIKAVKVLKYIDHDDLNNIMKEGIQLLRIDHPNIVKVHDLFLDPSQMVFIEMEYYAYGDLNIMIQSDTIYSEEILRKVLEQSCKALQYIHENLKIVHRDIKPSNIFLKSIDVANNDIQVVLADFGLAKDTHGSVAKSFAGTPLYMPPELSLGVNYSFNADVYSLGVTMYQIMTKDIETSVSYLYMTKDTNETLQILRNKMESSNMYSGRLIEVVLRMLEKDMGKRPTEVEILKQLNQ